MTQRRLSKRTSAITKRRLLEEKLQRRIVSREVRNQKLRSNHLRDLQSEELRKFHEEAFRLSDCVDRLLPSDSDTESVDTLERTVNEIIDGIASLDPVPLLESTTIEEEATYRRRKTSTDHEFLDEPVVGNFPGNSWPPRYPSQEPESPYLNSTPVFPESAPLSVIPSEAGSDSNSNQSDNNSDVFEASNSDPELVDKLTEDILGDQFKHLLQRNSEPAVDLQDQVVDTLVTMENSDFKEKMRPIKILERKVRDTMEMFTAQNVASVDLSNYTDRLKEVRTKLDDYNEAIAQVIVDLDSDDTDDKERISNLEDVQKVLKEEVLRNEREVSSLSHSPK